MERNEPPQRINKFADLDHSITFYTDELNGEDYFNEISIRPVKLVIDEETNEVSYESLSIEDASNADFFSLYAQKPDGDIIVEDAIADCSTLEGAEALLKMLKFISCTKKK